MLGTSISIPSGVPIFCRTLDERGYVLDYPLDQDRVDGSMMSALVSVSEWQTGQTGETGYQGVIRDISEQKRAQEQLDREKIERELAIVEERNSLARELHDSVTQSLYSIGLYANAAQRSLRAGHRNTAADHIKEVVQLALEALVDMRSLIFGLRPPVLVELGLATAIKTRLQAVEGRTDIAVEFRSSGKDGLPLMVQTELYRITQEALSNVVKHSHAEHVAVALDYGMDRATLEIRDDGDGFDMTKAQEKNTMGLRSITERAKKSMVS